MPDEDALTTATRLAETLANHLAPAVDPRTVSMVAKVPFKALSARELLAHRTAELSQVACALFRERRIISAVTITRAALEGIAWLFELWRRLSEAVTERSSNGLDDFLMRLLFGSRSGATPYSAFNVLKAIDAADRLLPGYRKAYDVLSELAHPNYFGTMRSFSRFDPTTMLMQLDSHEHQMPVDFAAPILAGALEIFIRKYDEMPPLLRDLARICEREIAEQFG